MAPAVAAALHRSDHPGDPVQAAAVGPGRARVVTGPVLRSPGQARDARRDESLAWSVGGSSGSSRCPFAE